MCVCVCVCKCVTVYPASQVCPRSLRMQGIVAIPGPRSAFAMVTSTALCLHPSMRLGSMGTRERMCVCVYGREKEQETEGKIGVRVEGPKFVVAVSTHKETHTTQTHTDTHTHRVRVKIPITFSQLSPLEQLRLCGRCSSLSGLFGSHSGGH